VADAVTPTAERQAAYAEIMRDYEKLYERLYAN
jgi:hypothetical protein